jgi:hypothetical protein
VNYRAYSGNPLIYNNLHSSFKVTFRNGNSAAHDQLETLADCLQVSIQVKVLTTSDNVKSGRWRFTIEECIIADSSKVILWNNHVNKLKLQSSYHLKGLYVRTYQTSKCNDLWLETHYSLWRLLMILMTVRNNQFLSQLQHLTTAQSLGSNREKPSVPVIHAKEKWLLLLILGDCSRCGTSSQ